MTITHDVATPHWGTHTVPGPRPSMVGAQALTASAELHPGIAEANAAEVDLADAVHALGLANVRMGIATERALKAEAELKRLTVVYERTWASHKTLLSAVAKESQRRHFLEARVSAMREGLELIHRLAMTNKGYPTVQSDAVKAWAEAFLAALDGRPTA